MDPRIPRSSRFTAYVLETHGGTPYIREVLLIDPGGGQNHFQLCRLDTRQKVPGEFVSWDEFHRLYGFTPGEAAAKASIAAKEALVLTMRNVREVARKAEQTKVCPPLDQRSEETAVKEIVRRAAKNPSLRLALRKDYASARDFPYTTWVTDEILDEHIGSLSEDRAHEVLVAFYGRPYVAFQSA